MVIACASIVAGCAAITGLDGYDVFPCDDPACSAPDGAAADSPSVDGGRRDDAGSNTNDAADCDKDPSACIVVPAGFELVAAADVGDGGAEAGAPACPAGFAKPSIAGITPAAKADSCTCDCAITKNGTCSNGQITNVYGTATCTDQGSPLEIGGGSCKPLAANVVAFSKLTAQPTSDGNCSPTQTVMHKERVQWAESTELCAIEASRCSGGRCDVSGLGAPFRVCVASADGTITAANDVACPAGFPDKRVLGTGASFTCGACGACTVSFTCTGTLDAFKNQGCDQLLGTLPVDGVCHPATATGAIKTYRANLTSQNNTCSVANPPATSPVVSTGRAVCCR